MSPTRMPALGAVLVRSPDPEVRLQGVRTALSLAMGDRPAALYLTGEGTRVLGEPPGSEMARCLEALPEAGVAILVAAPAGGPGARLPAGVRRLDRRAVLAALAAAGFQQVF